MVLETRLLGNTLHIYTGDFLSSSLLRFRDDDLRVSFPVKLIQSINLIHRGNLSFTTQFIDF